MVAPIAVAEQSIVKVATSVPHVAVAMQVPTAGAVPSLGVEDPHWCPSTHPIPAVVLLQAYPRVRVPLPSVAVVVVVVPVAAGVVAAGVAAATVHVPTSGVPATVAAKVSEVFLQESLKQLATTCAAAVVPTHEVHPVHVQLANATPV